MSTLIVRHSERLEYKYIKRHNPFTVNYIGVHLVHAFTQSSPEWIQIDVINEQVRGQPSWLTMPTGEIGDSLG